MEITYYSTYADLCRCTFYSLTHRRDLLWRFAFPILYGTFTLGHHFAPTGWLRFLLAAFVTLIVLGVVLVLIMQLLIVGRVLMPMSRRRFTTKLDAEFFSDISLRKSKSIPWSAISEIRYKNGDLYFWQKGKDGNFIPKSAFQNSQHVQAFFETAKGYWQSAKLGQPTLFAKDDSVWPPPPRVGSMKQSFRVFLPIAMIITFTTTKKDLWRSHPHAKFRNPLPLLLRLLGIPVLLFIACCISGMGWVRSLSIAVCIGLFPFFAWGVMMAEMIRDVSKPKGLGEKIAEIGKFDFRWGTPPVPGYYYHWSNFTEITDTPEASASP